MATLNCIGVLAHPNRPQTAPLADEIAQWLRNRGIETWLYGQWEETHVREHIAGTDMVIAIGGDGLMLRSARICATYCIPVLGVNMGHLGFLTEIKGPDDWERSMEDVLAGKYWVEQRMMIHALAWRGREQVASGHALNDIVIGRGTVTRTIHLDAYIDHEWTTTYNADALVIATATGSTAYALACGGPILPPELRNILVVPVAPHLSLDRPMVLPEGATVEIIVSQATSTETVLTADGEMLANLQPGDLIEIHASDNVGRFVRLREKNYFYRSLLDRLEPRIPVPPAPRIRQTDNRNSS